MAKIRVKSLRTLIEVLECEKEDFIRNNDGKYDVIKFLKFLAYGTDYIDTHIDLEDYLGRENVSLRTALDYSEALNEIARIILEDPGS